MKKEVRVAQEASRPLEGTPSLFQDILGNGFKDDIQKIDNCPSFLVHGETKYIKFHECEIIEDTSWG